jgi:Cytochrome oxidase complex assembly protein 1
MSHSYVPAPPPPSAGYSAQPMPDPLQQKKQTRIIVLAAIAVVLLIGLFVGGLIVMIFGFMRASEPYQHGVQTATSDARVIAELGAPVKPAWLFSGSIETSGPSGSADISIGLKGSRRRGTLYIVAKKSAGRWTYEVLQLRAEGQPDLDLRPPLETR